MTRTLRSFAVMGLVAALGVGLGLSASAQDPADKPPTKGKAAGKKAKATKKAPAKAEPKPDGASTTPDPGGLKFSRDIAPILSANCAGCHNPQHRSGLNQTTFATLMKGGKAGPPIVAGKPEESLLLSRIKGEEGAKMPPGNRQLSDTAVARIEQWIKDGARLDAGIDATAPMAKYAATPEDLRKAELAKLSPQDRDKKTEAVARDRLKKADPKAEPEMIASPHFLLFAEMPKERAAALLKTMEAQYARVNRLLTSGGSGLNLVEKVGLYVFKDPKGYSEFVRTVENQDVEAGDQARVKLGVESPYVLAIDPVAGGPEAPAKKAARAKKGDDATFGPERTLAGLLTEQLTSGAIAQAGKPPRWLTAGVGALFASQVEPRSPYYRRLRAEAYEQCRLGWPTKANEALGDQNKAEVVRAVGFAIAEWLASSSPNLLAQFVHGMLEGTTKLDDTIRACLSGTRDEFLAASGEYVMGHYGSSR